jgi:thioredoxin 1
MQYLGRLELAGAIIVAGILIYWSWSRARLVIVQNRAAHRPAAAGLEHLRPGIPAILYFSTTDCAPCRMVQTPAIQQVCDEYGENLQVIHFDASERHDLADYWGVLSVPTTFILDTHGRPRLVNNGVTPAIKLKEQLRQVIESGSGKGRAEEA